MVGFLDHTTNECIETLKTEPERAHRKKIAIYNVTSER